MKGCGGKTDVRSEGERYFVVEQVQKNRESSLSIYDPVITLHIPVVDILIILQVSLTARSLSKM